MNLKNYAVALKRTTTDYILVSATDKEDAIVRANMLIAEGGDCITLGMDGEDQEILGAEESEPDGPKEKKSLEANNEELKTLLEINTVL